jgi:hypothetical protein
MTSREKRRVSGETNFSGAQADTRGRLFWLTIMTVYGHHDVASTHTVARAVAADLAGPGWLEPDQPPPSVAAVTGRALADQRRVHLAARAQQWPTGLVRSCRAWRTLRCIPFGGSLPARRQLERHR